MLAHLGVAVFVVGVTLVKTYERERDANLKPGDAIELGGYVFRLEQVSNVRGPNYIAARARIIVTRGERPVTVLYPEFLRTLCRRAVELSGVPPRTL